MNLTDVIALAKAGYKPADIKELVSLAEPEQKDDSKDDSKDEPKEDSKEDPKEDSKDEPKDNKEIEDLKKEISDLKQALKTAQEANVKKDASGNEGAKKQTDLDILADYAKSFM